MTKLRKWREEIFSKRKWREVKRYGGKKDTSWPVVARPPARPPARKDMAGKKDR